MATFDYPSIAAIADDLIKQFGDPAILRRDSGDRQCVAVEVDYAPQDRDGQIIRYTDRRFLLSPLDMPIPPDSEQDKLIWGTETLRIVTARRTQPASVNVLWDLQTRK